jgi:hypothetical protein
MRNIILITLLIFAVPSAVYAQEPTPCYYLIYGNRDGSTIDVNIDSDIEIEVWIATPAIGSGYEDLDGDGVLDSLYFVHMPLASSDSIIVSRDGGEFFYPLSEWADVSFLYPNADTAPGYTNQSILGFCCAGPPPIQPTLFTGGDTIRVATFFMHTSPDSLFINEMVCPLIEGYNPANGGLLCGMQDGSTRIYPLQTFSCLYFVDYLAGDANGSGSVNGLDVVYMVGYLKDEFPPPDPILAGDANGDCMTNGLDVIYLLAYFKGLGPEPTYGNCH